MRRIRLIIAIPFAVIVIALSVANRHDIIISFDPLPWTMSLPLYLFAFLVFGLGALAGGAAVWGSAMRRRRQAARQAREQERKDQAPLPAAGPPAVRVP